MNKSVFINCPYDDKYLSKKKALIYAVLYCGYEPKLASMVIDGGRPRIEIIKDLINDSVYSIHDISRCKCTKGNEWYRMNMPFEMGIDFGKNYFSDSKKQILVLTAQRYKIDIYFSDFLGFDSQSHGNKEEKLVEIVWSFFYEKERNDIFPKSYKDIWYSYQDFQADLFTRFERKNIETINDNLFRNEAKKYINKQKTI